MIIQRIKDGNYNDVEAKAPVERVAERGGVDVSQEKSKIGLGEVNTTLYVALIIMYRSTQNNS